MVTAPASCPSCGSASARFVAPDESRAQSFRCNACGAKWTSKMIPEWKPIPISDSGPCPRCQGTRTQVTLMTSAGYYCLCNACGHAWHHDRRGRNRG